MDKGIEMNANDWFILTFMVLFTAWFIYCVSDGLMDLLYKIQDLLKKASEK